MMLSKQHISFLIFSTNVSGVRPPANSQFQGYCCTHTHLTFFRFWFFFSVCVCVCVAWHFFSTSSRTSVVNERTHPPSGRCDLVLGITKILRDVVLPLVVVPVVGRSPAHSVYPASFYPLTARSTASFCRSSGPPCRAPAASGGRSSR